MSIDDMLLPGLTNPLKCAKGMKSLDHLRLQVYAIGNPFGLDHTLTQVCTPHSTQAHLPLGLHDATVEQGHPMLLLADLL